MLITFVLSHSHVSTFYVQECVYYLQKSNDKNLYCILYIDMMT